MESIAKVLKNHRVHKKGIRQISRERNLSRNTVRKVLRGECESHQYVRSEQPRPKLGEYCERLERCWRTMPHDLAAINDADLQGQCQLRFMLHAT